MGLGEGLAVEGIARIGLGEGITVEGEEREGLGEDFVAEGETGFCKPDFGEEVSSRD